MCETCGCSDDSKPKLVNLQSGQTLAIGTANDRDVEHEHAGSAPTITTMTMITTTIMTRPTTGTHIRMRTLILILRPQQFAWKPMCSPRTTAWPSEIAAGLPAATSSP
jgi:hypothetical protein